MRLRFSNNLFLLSNLMFNNIFCDLSMLSLCFVSEISLFILWMIKVERRVWWCMHFSLDCIYLHGKNVDYLLFCLHILDSRIVASFWFLLIIFNGGRYFEAFSVEVYTHLLNLAIEGKKISMNNHIYELFLCCFISCYLTYHFCSVMPMS